MRLVGDVSCARSDTDFKRRPGLGPRLRFKPSGLKSLVSSHPVMKRFTRHTQIARHRRHTFAQINTLYRFQFEGRRDLATLRFATSLQRRSSSLGYL